jgi:hypothetical protein
MDPADPLLERIIYHELDSNEISKAKATVDIVGDYSGPKIFTLDINSNVHRQCVVNGLDGAF